MASSLISSSHHVNFESVFGFDDAGMVQMFETLITTGLKNFLGCPAIFYEAVLTEFFSNGSVRDGLVVSTVGVTVEISEKVFAASFGLPIDGLTDFSDVPKNLVFDARSLFSASKEQVSISCFKKEMKIEYRLLHDILAKTLFVKAGSFDAVTRERFMLMMAITFDVKLNWSNLLFGVLKAMVTPGSRQAKGFAIQIGVILQKVPGLDLGDSRPFPASRVLTENTMHRFLNINEHVGMENTAASPRVNKTPVKKAVSKKRQVGAGEEAPVMKKKRTTKGKPAAIALEAKKRRLVLDDADETGDSVPEQPAAEIAAAAQVPIVDDPVATQPDIVPTFEATTDDPVAMIEKILNQLEQSLELMVEINLPHQLQNPHPEIDTDGTVSIEQTLELFDETGRVTRTISSKKVAEEHMSIFMLARREAEGLLSSDTDEDLEQIFIEIDTDGTVSIEQTLELFDETGRVTRTISSKKVAEEHMSIDDLLLQISDDMLLPSVTTVEITKIRLGESISINEVQERDLYYASLPRISTLDKGKGILEEDEPVKGNPMRETVELICGDFEFLVQLRDRVMKDVVDFFHSFSLNKLSNFDALLELKEKEKLMLEWAETDSLETAVKRKVYILVKYREMLLRKFVESHRKYFIPGQPWTETASKIIDLLTVAHSKSLEALVAQHKEHGLPMEQPCTSTFLDTSVGSGAVLAQFYSMAKSTCWVRPLVLIDVQYWGAAPALIKTWGWHRVCTDVIRFSMFGYLRPVREDVCTDIVVYNLGIERIPASFCHNFSQGVDTDCFVRYFSDSDVESLAEIDLSSSDAPTVYRSPSPILQEADSFEHNFQFALGPANFSGDAQEELPYFVESPESPSPIYPCQDSSSSSTDVSMHFDKDDILLDDNANVQPTLSDVPADISPFFDDLKTYLSQRMDTANSDILSRLHTVERGIQDNLGQQNDYFRGLIQSARQDAHTQDNIQTLRFNEFRKNILAQNASIFTGLADVRKELSELVAYINRGGDNKKGESSSIQGPQPPPPPVDQIRGTGVNVSTPDFAQRVEVAQRNIMERVMDTDRREIVSYSGVVNQSMGYPDESYSESVLVSNQLQATVDFLTRRKLQWIA
ncbi:hypothetical protein F511_15859 [Dorcoceras hygrometricum]|uniref:Dystroglycan-like n=1 Tax=Dorcoceras hygrometricum TaxID=472368 RepID=A0A2Z7CV11_9LAMI|nr:hypothetical protein F511_15859 [Dorcoceras hygrometricum]